MSDMFKSLAMLHSLTHRNSTKITLDSMHGSSEMKQASWVHGTV